MPNARPLEFPELVESTAKWTFGSSVSKVLKLEKGQSIETVIVEHWHKLADDELHKISSLIENLPHKIKITGKARKCFDEFNVLVAEIEGIR